MTTWHTQQGGTNVSKNATEIKTDLTLLLECLKCHMNDASVQRDSLLTTAAICSTSDEAKEYFRECGGINFVLNLLTSSEVDNVKVAALYTLGCSCEKNVFSQKRLCTPALFKFIYCQLITRDQPGDGLKRTSAFLLLCLVTNNGEGQNLARTSQCLEALLKLFRSSSLRWQDTDASCKHLDSWTAITSTLCGCVNNPQNETNQQMCASAGFPTAIDIIRKTRNPRVIRLLSSFLSLTIANNANNQDRFGLLGGLEVLVDLLHSIIASLLRKPDQDTIEAAVQLTNVFVSCITDNDQNHSRLVDLNLVSMLIQLLSMEFIESDVKLKVIVTLGHLLEKCERSQRQLLESDGLSLLVHIMAEENHDEEFNKAAMYLLSSCVDKVSSVEGVDARTTNTRQLPIKPQRTNEVESECGSYFISHRNGVGMHNDEERRHKNQTDESNFKWKCTANDRRMNESDLLSNLKRKLSTKACDIDDLQRQLEKENHMRQQLENEVQMLERHGKDRQQSKERAKERAKEKAKAVTEELQRETPERLIDQDLKKMAHKLEMLDKKLHRLSSEGNELADNLFATSKKKKLVNSLPLPSGIVDEFQMESQQILGDLSSNSNACQLDYLTDIVQRLVQMKSTCLGDNESRFIRHLQSDPDKAHGHCIKAGQPSQAPSRSNSFRIPTSPMRQCYTGEAKPTTEARGSLLTPLAIGRRGHNTSGVSSTKPAHRVCHLNAEVESCCASVVTNTDMSLSLSDMDLVKQAKISNKQGYANSTSSKTLHPHVLSHKKKAKTNSKVTPVPQKGMFSVPSKPIKSQCFKRRNFFSTKDEYVFDESPSNISGTSSLGPSNTPHIQDESTCPACSPAINRPLLNSRNFVHTLERSTKTCPGHKELVRKIKQDVHERKALKANACDSQKGTRTHLNRGQNTQSNGCSNLAAFPSSAGSVTLKVTNSPSGRRKRQVFTPQEIQNLIEGVAKQGKHWNSILWRYPFAAGRTAVDLKDKYRRMQAQNYPGVLPSSPSSCKSFKQRHHGKVADYSWRP